MKVICLSGSSNTGKTSTLKKLISYIINTTGSTPIYTWPQSKTTFQKKLDGILKGDVCAKFEINGKVVGIATGGDLLSIVKRHYQNIQPCEIYICAVHPYGKTIEFAQILAKNDAFHHCGKSTFSSTNSGLEKVIREQFNYEQAVQLYKLI